MRTIVEEADSIQDLLTCVDPLMTLAELYTADFVKIFEDTADLIIGWLVDPTSYQSDQESYNQLVDQMIQLRPFWIASLKDSGLFLYIIGTIIVSESFLVVIGHSKTQS